MNTNLVLVVSAIALVTAAGLALSQDKSSQGARPKAATADKKQVAAPAAGVKPAADFPVIGYLEKRDRTITIKAGPKGPLYSVKTPDGRVLCENVSLEQLSAKAPELAEF